MPWDKIPGCVATPLEASKAAEKYRMTAREQELWKGTMGIYAQSIVRHWHQDKHILLRMEADQDDPVHNLKGIMDYLMISDADVSRVCPAESSLEPPA
ncbi:hypothetical protein GGF37_003820 [Kickxella alabastrina]|nr:hypothetical protein GGF37_003820 [Kickxella alabastrina]